MFEKEAEEYREKEKDKGYYWVTQEMEQSELDTIIDESFKDGAEFGYNKGYHDAEVHYMNVIDSQHKLVEESKKKDFRKCMKCTDGTYQYGFKDGYNKAKEEDKEKIQKLKAFIEELCFSLNNSSTDPCEDLLIYNAEQFIKEN